MPTKDILWLLIQDAFDIEEARARGDITMGQAYEETDALCAKYVGRLLD